MSRKARITIIVDIPMDQPTEMSSKDWIKNISRIRETWKFEDVLPLCTHQDSKVSWNIEPVLGES